VSAGEVPVCVAGVYSPTELRRSLGALGFDSEQTERALAQELSGETATRAVSIAEKRSGNAEVLA
jgi:SOS response regulatory protein OraA/RecX